MQIRYHKTFKKNYQKRIAQKPKLVIQFKSQLKKFFQNPADPTLRDHKLIGRKSEFRAFSITGDFRVVYKIVKNEVWFYDIATHNQVY